MASPLPSLLSAVVLIAICFALPYGLHIERQFKELRSEASALKAIEKNQKTPEAPPSEETDKPSIEIQAIPDTAPRPRQEVVTPTNWEARLLEEARARAATNPEDALQWLQTFEPTPTQIQAMLEVVAIWATNDAQSTLLWLESNAQGIARKKTLQDGIKLWGEQDPVAASEWIAGMANDNSKTTATASLAATWGANDPLGTAQWIFNMPTGQTRDKAAQSLIDSWIEKDPIAATEWAASESQIVGKNESLEYCIQTIANKDLRAAEDIIREFQPAYPDAALIEKYMQTRAQTDPSRASAWYTQLADDDPLKSERSAQALMKEWTQSDSVAASAWLSEQAPGPRRDAAINGFIETIQNYEPAAAVEWSNVIEDSEQRVQALSESIISWSQSDPDGAALWINESTLEPELRATLYELIEK